VGWHRAQAGLAPTPEVSTPNLDALVADGIDLQRHYGFKSCSPSRCSFQSGRLPVHVLEANTVPESFNPNDTVSGYAGIPRNMTTIATFMKRGGYKTAFVGKWDAGMATADHTPKGRGYDFGLSYFHHSNDYYTEAGDGTMCRNAIDIWATDGPANTFNTSAGRKDNMPNGTLEDYEEFKFMKVVVGLVQDHAAAAAVTSQPLFLTYAPHLVHEPLQVPTVYLQRFSSVIKDNSNRLWYSAMVAMLDDVVGNVTSALKATGMWDNTLLLFTSDNGGPSYNSAHTANNYPLRGSKLSDWEGGVRVSAFVAGGWVPPPQRGTSRTGLIAVADWLATFCEIANVTVADAAAAAAGLPPIDSQSMLTYLVGDGGGGSYSGGTALSPRVELQVDSNVLLKVVSAATDRNTDATNSTAANANLKLWKIFGSGFPSTPQGATGWACFPGPFYPNATNPGCNSGGDCDKSLGGCLFELYGDATEHLNLAASEADVMRMMVSRLAALQPSIFSPDRGQADQAACLQVNKNGGFYGPWLP